MDQFKRRGKKENSLSRTLSPANSSGRQSQKIFQASKKLQGLLADRGNPNGKAVTETVRSHPLDT
jgi:hypothetical protein